MEIVYISLNDRSFVIVKYDSWSCEVWDQMQKIFTYDDNRIEL